jgi:hypothetical protein
LMDQFTSCCHAKCGMQTARGIPKRDCSDGSHRSIPGDRGGRR